MTMINASGYRPAFGKSKDVAKIAKEILSIPKTRVTEKEMNAVVNNCGGFKNAISWIGKNIVAPLKSLVK